MLFQPFDLKGVKLENRLVRSATYEKRADNAGYVTDSLIEFYKNLAEGGVGLIITGNALVHPSGRSVPNMISIYDDTFIERLKLLTEVIHEHMGTVFIQLVHGGRQCFLNLLEGKQPIAPSAVYDSSTEITPTEMTEEDIKEILAAFRYSAGRAREAGFDGIQIHGAHGYLVNQFLSPYTNRRDDYWGGDEERRFHFLEKLYTAMRKELGDDYPLIIKMNSQDYIKGGLEVEESLRIALKLEKLGIDAVEVSGGMYESDPKPVQPNIKETHQEAYFGRAAGLFRKQLNIPVITVGGIRSVTVIEDLLNRGMADLISLSRPLVREPDLPNKFRSGKTKADCISCNGCMRFMKLDVVKCVKVK